MKMGKSFFIWLGVFVALSLIMSMMSDGAGTANADKIAFSDFMDKVDNKQVSEVVIRGANIIGTATNGSKFYTSAP